MRIWLFDFKGNPVYLRKRFCEVYDQTIDWGGSPTLLSDVFNTEISYDAMNRPVEIIQPDASVVAYAYNKAGLLETVQAKIRGITTYTEFVTNIDYNEKGQRTAIYYRNGSKTAYFYDDKSFRLTRLLTTRNTGQDILQDINYTYDAVGNITEIIDDAQQTFYFSNSVIAPRGKYWYDALYRLTKATGRELSSLAMPSDTDFANDIPVQNTDSSAMQNYTQEYSYDELGNIEQMKSVGDWTRDYYYETTNNRLKNHDGGSDVYAYDEHGNCTEMPHLPELTWDYKDELKEVTLDASNNKAYYVYDSTGERVRKVVDKGSVVEERLYIGGFEIYRKTVSGTLNYERETLKITEGRNTIAQLETKTIENGNTISTPTTNQRYQYSNHLGSACLELDENAEIISYEEYHPFGTTSYRSGNSETEVSLKRYKYVDKERDEETGLYYYGQRYYSPWTCRFISVDPLAADYPYLTPYNYAGNKPITHKDIDGLQSTGDQKVDNGGGGTNVIGPTPASEEYKKGEKAANKTTENIDINQIYPDGNLPQAGDKPTDLSHLIGTDSYYEARAIDFELRNPGETAPEYYREYGHKYLHEFKYETRDNLTPEGQLWLDKALVNLQKAMELGLQRDPNLESNSDAHRKFAFDTHVQAYEKAGLLELGIMDKVKITLTPEPQDLFSEEGLQQAGQVAADQLEVYKNNPRFAAQQAGEAAWGYYSGAIGEEVRKYAEENTGYAIPPTIWKLMLPF